MDTSKALTAEEVQDAMDYLEMTNPKPEVPVHVTIVGHLLVAVAERLAAVEEELYQRRCHRRGTRPGVHD